MAVFLYPFFTQELNSPNVHITWWKVKVKHPSLNMYEKYIIHENEHYYFFFYTFV